MNEKIIQINGNKCLTSEGRIFELRRDLKVGQDYWKEIDPPSQLLSTPMPEES